MVSGQPNLMPGCCQTIPKAYRHQGGNITVLRASDQHVILALRLT